MYLDSCTRALFLSLSLPLLAYYLYHPPSPPPPLLSLSPLPLLSVVLYNIVVVVVVSIRIVSAFDVTVLAPGQILRFDATELQEK